MKISSSVTQNLYIDSSSILEKNTILISLLKIITALHLVSTSICDTVIVIGIQVTELMEWWRAAVTKRKNLLFNM